MSPEHHTDFIDYVLGFYGEDGIYDMGMTRFEAELALQHRLTTDLINEFGKPIKEIEFKGDSFDREYLRDIVLDMRDCDGC